MRIPLLHMRAALVAAGVLLCTPGHAQTPAPQTAGNVTYLMGGIGESEVTALRAEAGSYSLMFEFVEIEPGSQHGSWTADVAVQVRSGNDVLANIAVTGPLLLLRLAPGRYVIDATHNDVKLTKTIEIKAKAALLRDRFIWRAAAGSLGSDLKNQ
jgi:hypothetical protein